jgi:hypothetical protein
MVGKLEKIWGQSKIVALHAITAQVKDTIGTTTPLNPSTKRQNFTFSGRK